MNYYIITDDSGKYGLAVGRQRCWIPLGRKGSVAPEEVRRFFTKKEAAAKAKALRGRKTAVKCQCSDCNAKVEKRQAVLVALRSEDCRETQFAEFPSQAAAKSFCRSLRGTTWEWAIEVPKKA